MRAKLRLMAISVVLLGTIWSCKDKKNSDSDQCLVTEMKQVVAFEDGDEGFEIKDLFTYNNSKKLTRWVSDDAESQFEALFTYGSDGKLSSINVESSGIDVGVEGIKVNTRYNVTHSTNLIKVESNDQVYPSKMEIILEKGKVVRYDEYYDGNLEYQTKLTWKGENVILEESYSMSYNEESSMAPKTMAKLGSFSTLKRFLSKNKTKRNESKRPNQSKKKLAELVLIAKAEIMNHDSKNGFKGIEAYCFLQSPIVLSESNISQIKFTNVESGENFTVNYNKYKTNDSGYPISAELSIPGSTSTITFKYQCD